MSSRLTACLLRVTNGSGEPFAENPLDPDERTSSDRADRPVLCQELPLIGHLGQTFAAVHFLLTSSAQQGDQRVELIESLPHSVLHPGGDSAFQRCLAGEQLVQSETRPALVLLESDGDYRLACVAHPLIELCKDQP